MFCVSLEKEFIDFSVVCVFYQGYQLYGTIWALFSGWSMDKLEMLLNSVQLLCHEYQSQIHVNLI